MDDNKIQDKAQIVVAGDILDNLSSKNGTLLTYLAGGMKPAEASQFWNSQNDEQATAEHCSMIKNRYKQEYSLMRADVLKQVHFQTLGGAVVMARDRLVEMLLKYEGKGKQGTLTECLNALQGLSKLYKDAGEELQSISPDTRSESAQAVMDKLQADNNADQQ